MHAQQIDNVSAGYVFAYDDASGEVLWTHEKIVEVVRGQEACILRISAAECEQVRVEAARVFPDRKVKALIAPQGFALGEKMRITVDSKTQALREDHKAAPTLAERFAQFSGKSAATSK